VARNPRFGRVNSLSFAATAGVAQMAASGGQPRKTAMYRLGLLRCFILRFSDASSTEADRPTGRSPRWAGRRQGRSDIASYYFCCSFHDRAPGRMNFPSEVTAMPLVHAVGDRVEVAYQRGGMFEKRRRLMASWDGRSSSSSTSQADVVALPPAKAAAQ
jgi:hypothetical protein